jgi:hypothetical protein
MKLLRLLFQLLKAPLGVQVDGILGDVALHIRLVSDASAHSGETLVWFLETYNVESLLRCLGKSCDRLGQALPTHCEMAVLTLLGNYGVQL